MAPGTSRTPLTLEHLTVIWQDPAGHEQALSGTDLARLLAVITDAERDAPWLEVLTSPVCIANDLRALTRWVEECDVGERLFLRGSLDQLAARVRYSDVDVKVLAGRYRVEVHPPEGGSA